MTDSSATILMGSHLRELFGGGVRIEPEYRFCFNRRWRFDFAVPALMLAIEIEGGAWTHGRHTRGHGYISDLEKYNTAILMGYDLFRFTPEQVLKGEDLAILTAWKERRAA